MKIFRAPVCTLAIALLPGALFSAPLHADSDARAADEQPAAATELVCRREAVTGSRISKKVCWLKEDRERGAEDVKRMLDRPRTTLRKDG